MCIRDRDVDLEGNVVALTLEHASANVDLGEVSFQQIVAAVPQAYQRGEMSTTSISSA